MSAQNKIDRDQKARQFPPNSALDYWIAADGWRLRHLRLDQPVAAPKGSLLFLGGRGDTMEKYFESYDHWRNMGWAVESVDWRGQGGSGRNAADPHVGHIDDFATWIGDITTFVRDWKLRTAGPHVIVAHSMGGHLVTRALAEGRIAPDAAVLVAPMLGFAAPYPLNIGLMISRLMIRLMGREKAAWKESEKPGVSEHLRAHLLTHDPDRYADEMWWRKQNPEIELGPPSWGWVERAYESVIGLEQPGVLERITVPMLLLNATADKLVSTKAIDRGAARLPRAHVVHFGNEAAHELLREADPVRDRALAAIDDFLATTLKNWRSTELCNG